MSREERFHGVNKVPPLGRSRSPHRSSSSAKLQGSGSQMSPQRRHHQQKSQRSIKSSQVITKPPEIMQKAVADCLSSVHAGLYSESGRKLRVCLFSYLYSFSNAYLFFLLLIVCLYMYYIGKVLVMKCDLSLCQLEWKLLFFFLNQRFGTFIVSSLPKISESSLPNNFLISSCLVGLFNPLTFHTVRAIEVGSNLWDCRELTSIPMQSSPWGLHQTT